MRRKLLAGFAAVLGVGSLSQAHSPPRVPKPGEPSVVPYSWPSDISAHFREGVRLPPRPEPLGLADVAPTVLPKDRDLEPPPCLFGQLNPASGQAFLRMVHKDDEAGGAAIEKLGGKVIRKQFPGVEFPMVVRVEIAGLKTSEGVHEALAKFPLLNHLSLAGKGVTDSDLEKLAKLAGLESLEVWGDRITDAGMKHLAALSKLKSLNVRTRAEGFTDGGMMHLKALAKLESLRVEAFTLTGRGLEVLSDLPELSTLKLFGAKIDLAGATRLRELRKLKTLEIISFHVGEEALKELRKPAGYTLAYAPGC